MNKIICGNSADELRRLEDNSVDLIITSPPYLGQREYKTNSINEIGHEPNSVMYNIALAEVFSECFRVCKPTGNIVFNIGDTYKDQSLQLLPYRFAITILDHYKHTGLRLINEITWVKTNPTPRQYKKRLISSTEPFLHFAKTKNYYYNPDAYLNEDSNKKKIIPMKKSNSFYQKGGKYIKLIKESDLSNQEKINAHTAVEEAILELRRGKITDFRMKIRGMHKEAFGGQSGGRNSQIRNNGFTVIKMYGNKLKRDVIENSVANTKNIDHPAIFPLKVIIELVKLLSKENDIILDPFCGSGQTCVVAKSLNRKYLGIDLSEKYCKIAEDRLKNPDS